MTMLWRTEGPNHWVLVDPDARPHNLPNKAWVDQKEDGFHITLWKDGVGWKRRVAEFSTLEEAKTAAAMAVRMGVV